jgi:hypothetical protein
MIEGMNGDRISLLGVDDVSRSCDCGSFSFFTKVQEQNYQKRKFQKRKFDGLYN